MNPKYYLFIAIAAGVLAVVGIIADVAIVVTANKKSAPVKSNPTATTKQTPQPSSSTTPSQSSTSTSTTPSSSTTAPSGSTTTLPSSTSPGTTVPGATTAPGSSSTSPTATTIPQSSTTSSPSTSSTAPISSTSTPGTTTTAPSTSATSTTTSPTTSLPTTTAAPSGYTWKVLKIGAGGWVTGIDINKSGAPVLIRTDVGGAYRWNEATATWTQLVTAASGASQSGGNGVMGVVSAPSDPNRVYMAGVGSGATAIWRSNDQGNTWTKTALQGLPDDGNGDGRQCGERLTVDPANKDIVFYGSTDGNLRYSTNAGDSWTTVTDFKSADTAFGIAFVVFDPATSTGTKTNTVYAWCTGCGIWRSQNGGTSWSDITGGGVPATKFSHGVVVNSVLYIAGPGGAWKYSGGSWTSIAGGMTDIWSIAVNPFNPQHIILSGVSGASRRSTNGGSSWTSDLTLTRTAADIPWLGWTDEGWMSNGNVVFDPSQNGRLWFAEGIGVWRTTDDTASSTLVWQSVSRGIEQMTNNDIVVPVSGKPVTAHWDRAMFYHYNLDAYPSTHAITKRFNSAWDVAIAGQNPRFVVASVYDHRWCCPLDQSAWSSDGGITWTQFTATNPDLTFGDIAVAASTTDNIVRLPTNDKPPYYTMDRGNTWNAISLPGVSNPGSHQNYYLRRNVLAADTVADKTFYLFHDDSNQVFISTNGGVGWTGKPVPSSFPTYSATILGNFNAKLKAVPGKQGHVCFTTGHLDGTELPMACSTDSASSWTAVPHTGDIRDFGFGAPEIAGGYPTLFVAGKVNSQMGVWCSSSQGARWGKLADYPLGILDDVGVIEGDMGIFGRVYAGFGGTGFAYGTGQQAGVCG